MLLSGWLLGVIFLACQVLAGKTIGGLEKIWMYDAYVIAWKTWGSSQALILQRGQSKGAYNSHWGTANDEGMLTFQEFMEDITNKARGTCTVEAPDTAAGRDVLVVAEELSDAGFGALVETQIANKRISATVKKYNKTLKKYYYVSKYSQLIETLYPAVTKARAILGDSAIKDLLDEMRTLAPMIASLRQADFYPWMIKDLNKWFQANAENNVPEAVTEDRTTPEGDKYQIVDWRATAKKWPSFFGVGTQAKSLQTWVKNYGDYAFSDPDVSEAPDQYSKSALSHYQTIVSWGGANKELNKAESACTK